MHPLALIGQAPTQRSARPAGCERRLGQRARADQSADRARPTRRAARDSTASRARTSSPRLVSWVDSVVMAGGVRTPAGRWRGGGTPSGGTPNSAGVAADLVERDEPVVAVEGGVLDALGHDHAPLVCWNRAASSPSGIARAVGAPARRRAGQVGTAPAARVGGACARCSAAVGQVGAVHREAHASSSVDGAARLSAGLPGTSAAGRSRGGDRSDAADLGRAGCASAIQRLPSYASWADPAA